MDPLTAFVSYSRQDQEFALRLANDLRANGQWVWMDRLDIHVGQRWEDELSAALKRCPRLLVILSPASVDSSNVMAEVAFAIDSGKEVLPVLYRDCDIPFRLRPFLYADFRASYDRGLQELLGSMARGQTASVTAQTAVPPRGSPPTQPRPRTPDEENGGTDQSKAQSGSDPGKVGGAARAAQVGDVTQPISATGYAVIAGIGLVLAVLFTLFYVYQVPRLVESGTQGQVFYLLLIPWALASAAFLFGAMKSYARFTHRHLGNFLELGGPVVLFCLVLLGGFKLVPHSAETFDLTVRAHSEDGRDPIITSGKVTLDLDNDRRTAALGANGEADFKAIPGKFKDGKLGVLAQVDGYDAKWRQVTPQGNVVDLALTRAAQPETVLKGRIIPPPKKGQKVKIFVEGQSGETTADDLGRFELAVKGRSQEPVRVEVFVDGKQVYDDTQVLPGPVELRLHKPN